MSSFLPGIADVWMQIPEGVDTIDLYVENTQAFQGVPIEN